MLEQLIDLDKEILLFFNGMNHPWIDPVMLIITETLAWLPLYLFLLYLIIKDYRKEAWIVLLSIGITILLADQITATLMKPYFARLRPSQEPTLQGLIHLVNDYKGGLYGFASSHAANTFGAATFFYLLYANTRRWIGLLFLWAFVMTYSRIYLGVHYPGDIIVGALVGVLSAIVAYRFFLWSKNKYEKRKAVSA